MNAVQPAIEAHLPAAELRVLQAAEASERSILLNLVEQMTGGGA